MDLFSRLETFLSARPRSTWNAIVVLVFVNFIVFFVSSFYGVEFELGHKVDFLVFYRAWQYMLTNPALVYHQIPNAGPTCINDFSWCTGYNYGNSFLFTIVFSPLGSLDPTVSGWIFRIISFGCVLGSVALVQRTFRSFSTRLLVSVIILVMPIPAAVMKQGALSLFAPPFTFPLIPYVGNYWAGQSDSIVLLLFTASIFFLSKDKRKLSYLTYAASLVKPEPLVLLPLYLALVVLHLRRRGAGQFELVSAIGWIFGFILLVNLPIILYSPWLNGYVSLVLYRDTGSAMESAITSIHEYVWLYSIPILSGFYVLQLLRSKEGVRQKQAVAMSS